MTPAQAMVAKAREVLRPDERLTPDQWASRNIVLTRGTTSRPGHWKSYPWQVDIINAVQDKRLNGVVIIAPRQLLGKSSMLNCIVGWSIASSPCPMLIIQQSIEACEAYSKNKLSPLIVDTQVLRKLVHEDELRYRRRGAGDSTVSLKRYPGGYLILTSAASTTGIRGHSVKRVFCDEVSSYPIAVSDQDPIEIATKTAETYPDSFVLLTSTPGLRGQCRITREFEEDSDQRRWFITCPACHHEFVLAWSHVCWPKHKEGKVTVHDTREAYVQCPACDAHHDDATRQKMALAGHWVATNPASSSRAGFHASGLISCSRAKAGYRNRLHQWAEEFLRAERRGVTFQRAFLTNTLAEPYSIDESPAVPYEHLYARREKYREVDGSIVIPDKALFCVIGADVQPDRVEAERISVGFDGEVWALEFEVFRGNVEAPTVWKEFDAWCQKRFRHESGHWLEGGVCVAVDSRFKSEAVYRYVRSCVGRRVFAIRGERGFAPLGSAWTTRSTSDNERLYLIRVDGVKESLFSRLRLTEYGPGYQHFPSNDKCNYDMEYFRQLTCERLTTSPGGQQFYVKPSGSSRNEACDARVYALSAAEILKPDYRKIKLNLERPPENDWRERQQEKAELLAMPIPDLRDPQPAVANDVNMDALRSRLEVNKKFPGYPRPPSWMKDMGK